MRRSEINEFLASARWQDAKISSLAGDASRRRYYRLQREKPADGVVLMDAPPDSGEDVRPFVKIAHYLQSIGLNAPEILHVDPALGLMLIEDLGDDLFARVVASQPDLEPSLYEAATDVLVHLHEQSPPKNLATYTTAFMTEQAGLVFDWYLKGLSDDLTENTKTEFATILDALVCEYASEADVLIQRDYHSENLLWLPQRHGLKRVGLLDFQDATLGHRMYDLVSLLQDARRDVPPEIETAMRQRYSEKSGRPLQEDEAAYAVLGAQRNLRIIGVFTRLAVRDGKPHYLDLMPRVWHLLSRDLAHPALAPLRQFATDLFPAPTDAVRNTLRQKCETPPIPS